MFKFPSKNPQAKRLGCCLENFTERTGDYVSI